MYDIPRKYADRDYDFKYSKDIGNYSTSEHKTEHANRKAEYDLAQKETPTLVYTAKNLIKTTASREWNITVGKLVENFELLGSSGPHWTELKKELKKAGIPLDYFKNCQKQEELKELALSLSRFIYSDLRDNKSSSHLEQVVEAYIKAGYSYGDVKPGI